MKIVVDENMPLADAFFQEFGAVIHKSGRSITRKDLLDADALLVRSVTTVDEELLSGTSVDFVGSATIGVDHMDLAFLRREGIGFASAPGCNADAVVNYVLTSLLELETSRGIDLGSAQVGIVGLGNVGRRLKLALDSWGVRVVACDPLLDTPGPLVDMGEILRSDVVSLHVPLVKEGRYPTYYLMDHQKLSELKHNAVLINTSRGSVIDNSALCRVLNERSDLSVVLDVWESEPMLNKELANLVDIATPHIAGYSYDGKVKGTEMVYQAFCRHLGVPIQKTLSGVMDREMDMTLDPKMLECEGAITALSMVRAAYSVMEDDAGLRNTLKRSNEQRCRAFDQLRKGYRLRREFSTISVNNKQWLLGQLAEQESKRLLGLGFKL